MARTREQLTKAMKAVQAMPRKEVQAILDAVHASVAAAHAASKLVARFEDVDVLRIARAAEDASTSAKSLATMLVADARRAAPPIGESKDCKGKSASGHYRGPRVQRATESAMDVEGA